MFVRRRFLQSFTPCDCLNQKSMNLVLKRTHFTKDGIFGILTCKEQPRFFCHTLEHSYQVGEEDRHLPKLEVGRYKCVRGPHKLPKATKFIETFEIENVPGHENILFHVGNYERDSAGCVLLGSGVDYRNKAIYYSKAAFEEFMDLLVNQQSFDLVVIDEPVRL